MQLNTQDRLRLIQTIATVLDIDPGRMSLDQPRTNYTEWDSLKHFEVMTAIESEFGFRFTSEELTNATEIADIELKICQKTEQNT